jgi:hypothetical protein
VRLDDMVALLELVELISGGERLSRKRRRKCRKKNALSITERRIRK